MPELQPIDQWFEPIAGTTEVRLREPTGEPYDPNGLPPWITRTGIDYLQANPGQVKLTFFFNMQQIAADLGSPGEFEEQMATATMAGDRFMAVGFREDETYLQRFVRTLESRPMPIFDTGNPPDPTAGFLVAGIRAAFLKRLKSNNEPARAIELLEDTETMRREGIIKGAAGAMLLHVLDWSVLDFVGSMAANQGGQHHAVVSLKPLNLDLVRKATMLGLAVDARRIGEDEWPLEMVTETHHTQFTLETGKFDTAGL